ncbi:Putative galactosyl transferase [gamma proteobacterium HdN1]|nr:Putative galactosyl transferase [gamma proteobacterium HdN1]
MSGYLRWFFQSISLPASARMNVTAWIIALNPENPVANALERSLRDQGILASIRPAVDGRKEMPSLQGRERLNQRDAVLYRQTELTATEVGCYLSHYRLIQEAYDTGLSHICLFEDDVVAEHGLGDLLREIAALEDTFHLTRLMSLKIRKRKLARPLSHGYSVVRPLRGALGTQGYVVNRTGMKEILDFGANIYMPIDKLYDSFFLYNLNCYSVEPHAIYETSRKTSVEKTRQPGRRNLSTFILWQLSKLRRSLRRRLHYLTHRAEYYPATKPNSTLGKSERIR